ncbi:branched-chain amino acid ABC transporter substrate-binding protein [Herbaspirillum lusitanum]|uniref:Branched-chain amino acid ABC transporter substrate-binding protein n=1 Tax=Herbaspirillum lusitanum TaxID=213312 RepID=A0ABW9A4H7_9BURK
MSIARLRASALVLCLAALLSFIFAAKPFAAPAVKSKKTEVAAQAVEPASDDEAPAVLIGFAGPLSGSAAGVGKSMLNAAQLAVDEANQRGFRIKGKAYVLKLVMQDDHADPRTAEYVAGYLSRMGVVGVIGHWNSAASLAAAPVYNKAGVIQISGATMSTAFTGQAFPAVFRTIGNNDGAGAFAADYAVRELKAQKIALIDDRTPFGRGFAEQFGKTAQQAGAEVIGTYSVSDKTSDFNQALLDIKKKNPDAVFFGGLDWQAALMAKALRRLKIEARLIVASGSVGLPFLMSAGPDANGTVVLEPGLPLEQMPGWKGFRQRYNQKFDTNIDLYATFAYDAAQVLIAAMRQANSVEAPVVAQELHKIRFSGVSGMISFNADGDLRDPRFSIYEVKNQQWVPVKLIGSDSR